MRSQFFCPTKLKNQFCINFCLVLVNQYFGSYILIQNMRNTKSIILFFIVGLLLSSCNSPEKILRKKDGRWEFESGSVLIYEDNVLIGEYDGGWVGCVVQFDKDNLCLLENEEGKLMERYYWRYDEEEKLLTLRGHLSVLFQVDEFGETSQVWSRMSTRTNLEGKEVRSHLTYQMKKIE